MGLTYLDKCKTYLMYPRTVEFQIKPCLSKLYDDEDMDVKYFAHEALGELSW